MRLVLEETREIEEGRKGGGAETGEAGAEVAAGGRRTREGEETEARVGAEAETGGGRGGAGVGRGTEKIKREDKRMKREKWREWRKGRRKDFLLLKMDILQYAAPPYGLAISPSWFSKTTFLIILELTERLSPSTSFHLVDVALCA